ncbi:MAG: ABC transporter permease [Armatimonadota bacterium]|nr:ABC transporter permease [Armatimonadota bacterium]MDR7534970.1 ABC transporter permease [Armatimonadota bacterium]
MTSYLAGRVLALVPVLLVVAAVVFGLTRFTPGDPVRVLLGEDARPEQVQALRRHLGLDRPLVVQFGLWTGRALRGDLGVSYFNRLPVRRIIAQHIGPTMMLSLVAITVALCIGIPVGIVSAVFRNSWLDQASLALALLGAAVPSFWLGLSLIVVFAVGFGWLPSSGFKPLTEGLWPSVRHLILPALALGLPNSALIIRFVRSSLLDVIGADYVRTARAKGLAERVVIFRHALRNALVPILTVVGLTFAALMGGAVVTETVFAIPGLGQLVVSSVLRRDYPVIQGVTLVVTTSYVLINLVVDVLYLAVDPRVKY